MPTINDLRQQATTIKNATQVGENTATRVGTTFETIADLLEGASVGQGVPSVDLSQLNALRTPADQTTTNPTIYNVTTLHNLSSTTIKVGTLFIFSDGGRAVVTQILLSNYQVDGGGNISSPNTSQITMYYRMFNIAQETWSAWTLYAGGGGGGTIDPYPVSGSSNAVESNGVFEGLQKAAPEVDINDIDDLDDFVDMQTGVASTYTIKAYHNLSSTWLRVGVLMVFANQAQNTLTQICISNCMVDGGGNLIPNYTTNVMNVFYRFKQFSGVPPEGMTIGVWTTWAKFGDSGYQPDNEDIDLNANDQLQFANKSYDASAFSGLGRVYLRKNIVTSGGVDKNVLTQAMVNTANTIYHIQYDYDLNGQTITLPAGCVLEFDGGSLTNGVLNIANGLQIQGFAKIDAEVSATGAYGSKTCDVYLNGEAHKDPITYTEVRYAQKYSCVLNLAYAHNTPSRYGAKCDGVTDDTNALQCVIDVIGWDYGELDLRVQTTEGKAGFLVTSPLQIKYKPTGQDDENYKSRQRITRIFSDNYQENDNLHPTIIAKNIPAKEAALELLGYSNGVDSSTSMEHIYIDASDSSNNALSFAFMVRDSKLNVFKCCRFSGINGVLDLSGHSANDIHAGSTDSYSKICMTWENCYFATTSQTRGWAYCNGTFLDMGKGNGDNSLFLSCEFWGHTELHATAMQFVNCMWACRLNKDAGTANELGYITDNTRWEYNKTIDFNDAIAVIRVQLLTLENCYFEDYNNGVVVCGMSTNSWALLNNVDNIILTSCYFNGLTNQKDGNNVTIHSNAGIYIAEGLGESVKVTINNCGFRDWDESIQSYLFIQAAIVNMNRYPIYCNSLGTSYRFIKEKLIGNIVFNDTPKTRCLPVKKMTQYVFTYYDTVEANKEGYENIAFIVGPLAAAPTGDVGQFRIINREFTARDSNGYPQFNALATYRVIPIYNAASTFVLTDGSRYILVSQSKMRNKAVYYSVYNDNFPIGVYNEANSSLTIKSYTTNADIGACLCRAVMCQDTLNLTFDEAYALLTEGAENVITKANIPTSMKAGFSIIDNGKPIYWTGTGWVDATGAAV